MTAPLSREIEIDPPHTTLLLVDVQNYNCLPNGGEYAHLDPAERDSQYGRFFKVMQDTAVPNMAALIQACRRGGIEVTYTVIESLTADGRDRSLDYKITGFNVPKGSWEAKVIEPLAPEPTRPY